MKKLYLMETDEVIKELNSCEDGLRLEDITWRREKYGLNEIQKAKKENIVMKFIHELSNLMTIVLITAAVISGFNAVYAGESLLETGIILFVVFMNAVIGVIQKSRVCQVFCVSFKKIFWGGEPPHLYHPTLLNDTLLKCFGNISNRVSCQ